MSVMLERPHLVGHVHSHNVAASAHHLVRIDQVLGEVVVPQGTSGAIWRARSGVLKMQGEQFSRKEWSGMATMVVSGLQITMRVVGARPTTTATGTWDARSSYG
jgi:hypothetical protein